MENYQPQSIKIKGTLISFYLVLGGYLEVLKNQNKHKQVVHRQALFKKIPETRNSISLIVPFHATMIPSTKKESEKKTFYHNKQ